MNFALASPAEVLLKYLQIAGLVQVQTMTSSQRWPAVIGAMPADGNNVVVLTNTGGYQEGRLMNTGERVLKPTVQVLVRGADEPTGWKQGARIQNALDKVGIAPANGGVGWQGITIGTESFILKAAHVMTPLMTIGHEEGTRRWLGSLNVCMTITQE